jgi:hypothetical protein
MSSSTRPRPNVRRVPVRRNSCIIIVFLVVLIAALPQSGCLSLSGNLTASQTNLSFGNVAIGSSSNQSLTFRNSGTAPFNITRAVASGGGFTVTGPPLPLTLAAGQSTTFMARFAPSAIGSASGSLMITSAQETMPQLTSGSGSATPSIVTEQKTIAMAGTGVSAAPSITTQPASQTVTAGQIATFSVTSSGAAPLNYQWSKNGGAITGATSTSYTTPATATSDSGSQFTVAVSNSAGNVTSNAATLTVTAVAGPPSITTQPASQTVVASQTATFQVTASGASPLSYQWSKNGTAVPGATSTTYTTPATATSDSGSRFTVVVSNSAGNVTSNAATLTVTAAAVAPSITVQPTSQAVTAGQIATFYVTSSGTAPLSYKWLKNGKAVSGATSPSYTTPSETASDSGAQFTVVVSNSVGIVTSTVATLIVNATSPGQLTASASTLNFHNVNVGSGSTLGVTFTDTGGSNITVSSVSISGAGYNASGMSTGLILTPSQTAILNVTFAPAATGSVTGTVNVTSNTSNSSASIILLGTGIRPGAHSATLAWPASMAPTVTGYNVYRATVSGGYTTPLNSSPIPVSTTQFEDSTVQAGQTYYYVFTMIDSSNGWSPYSNEVSGTIPTP